MHPEVEHSSSSLENFLVPSIDDSNPLALSKTAALEQASAKMASQDIFTSPIPTRAQKRMTPPSPLKQTTAASRFTFFGLRRQEETKPEVPQPVDDEFLNLDIENALFPSGSADLKGQNAFDALEANAVNTIQRMQAAYKQRTFALHEAMMDKTDKQEELEETKTRVGHLKVQLDSMAEKVAEQEKAMKATADALEQERQLRQLESEARSRGLFSAKPSDDGISDGEPQTPERMSKRGSQYTISSDSDFDSENESVVDSVFSRRDGAGSPGSITSLSSANASQVTLASTAPNHKEDKQTPTSPMLRQSTYDRVLKGLASTGLTRNCTNCHGVPASEAWDVMGILKDENKGLKSRLGELEVMVDDCLGLVA